MKPLDDTPTRLEREILAVFEKLAATARLLDELRMGCPGDGTHRFVQVLNGVGGACFETYQLGPEWKTCFAYIIGRCQLCHIWIIRDRSKRDDIWRTLTEEERQPFVETGIIPAE